MRFALPLLAIVALLFVASPARAGGDFVDLAAGNGRVWFVGEPGVREFDARSGRLLASPHLVGAAYPLSVALAGGASEPSGAAHGGASPPSRSAHYGIVFVFPSSK
jgi:hypothetical protein